MSLADFSGFLKNATRNAGPIRQCQGFHRFAGDLAMGASFNYEAASHHSFADVITKLID